MSFLSADRLGFAVHPVMAPTARWADAYWFTENPGFVLEIEPGHAPEVPNIFESEGHMVLPLGQVTDDGRCVFDGTEFEGQVARFDRAELFALWQGTLASRFAPGEEALA